MSIKSTYEALYEASRKNFCPHILHNPYPGRGIVVGLDQTAENLVQVYWIMGRSEGSRNRVFVLENGVVRTVLADPSKAKPGGDLSLIIYNAMMETPDDPDWLKHHIVSNGRQTDAVAELLPRNFPLEYALGEFEYEPDAPNFTTRITASTAWLPGLDGTGSVFHYISFSQLRKSPWSEESDSYNTHFNNVPAGYGYCVTTYAGDGNPLPQFTGDPLFMPLPGDIKDIAKLYWRSLNMENKVALVVKFIPRKGEPSFHIINKHDQVPPP
jgi:hypothetical protein